MILILTTTLKEDIIINTLLGLRDMKMISNIFNNSLVSVLIYQNNI